jgi:glycosyltransferase involved in cell wall biosynthesis
MPTKILFMIGTLDVGGTETQLVELVTRLSRERFEPVVCCLSSGGPLESRLAAAGIPVHALRFEGFRSKRYRYLINVSGGWRLLTGLRRVMRRERPVILHVMLFWAYILGTFAGRAAGVPIVVASRRSLGLFKADKPLYLFLERIVDRMTDLFIANSEAVRQDTIAREPVAPQDILVIRNGLDLSRFDAAPDPQLAASIGVSGSPVAIVVSNLIRYKGHEYFLRAWQSVVQRFPSAQAVLVGDGVLRADLERLVDDLRIRQAVHFLGVRSDVPALLALADLYVHPSLQEGYSNAVLEAMAAGKAVIATAVGGNVEAISDGETGLLVPAQDAAALAAAMMRVLGDDSLARRLSQNARRHVRATYDVEVMVRQYENVYEQLLARHAGKVSQAGRAVDAGTRAPEWRSGDDDTVVTGADRRN